jgi:hypothetical protein
LILFFLLACIPVAQSSLWAQATISNLKQKTFNYQQGGIQIDSLPILPLRLEEVNDSLPKIITSGYEIIYNRIVFEDELTAYSNGKSFRLHYRILPYDLKKTFRRIDTTLIQQDPGLDYIGFSYEDLTLQETLIDFEGMNYSGSFARGLSFGNRQNLVLNSSLNLQLAGTLGNDLKILAAISDNEIPIQPEGNTQQLQEFDRIYIEISKDQNTLRAGDFEIGRPRSYFMNYFKRSQGVMASNVTQLGEGKTLTSSASLAISKGKFRRQFIQPIEGNQGPYKLLGNDGEIFIIVLANTERVFLDGEMLKRGLEYDYVIDYNRGEVLFTAKRLIHKDVRIIVEFEYTDQNYLRSMYTLESTYESEKLRIDFNYFSEQDSKNSPGTQQLNDEDILLLSQIGDNIEQALVSSIRPPPEDGIVQNAVLYERRDTLMPDGRIFPGILVFSIREGSERFTASFTDQGQGNGNYIIGANLANGRVYQWVAPDPVTGQPQGRYEPVIRIVTPKKQQMMTIGASYALSENSKIKSEFGLSSLDINTFSPLDKSNNIGVGGMFGYEGKIDFGKENIYSFQPYINYEFKEQNFRAINQYRPAEFQRDWNIDVAAEALEHLATAGFRLQHKNLGSFLYDFSGFHQQGLYNGTRHNYDLSLRHKGYALKVFGSELFSENTSQSGRFSRPRFDVSKTFNKLGDWKLGFYGEREKNELYQDDGATLAANSFQWDIGRIYIQSPSEKPFTIGASFTLRDDILPKDNEFNLASRAREWRVEGGWRKNKNSILTWNFTSRELEVPDTESFNFTPTNTYLGRLNYQFNALKNVIRSNTAYEIGSGQEPKLEFTYIEVRPGEGQYIWTDLNNDGIQQLDEFQLAPFQDVANFARVANVTNEFVRTNNTLFNQQFLIDPRAVWYGSDGWKKMISRFSFQSNVNLQRKSGENSAVNVWDPFYLNFEDESLVFLGAVMRNSIFFNRADPKFEMQLNFSDLQNRNLLTTGFESRRTRENDITTRWNPGKLVSLRLRLVEGTRGSETEIFESRNYSIQRYQIEQEVVIQPGNQLRTTARLNYVQQENVRKEAGETSVIYQGGAETVYNKSNKFVMRGNISLAYIEFDGQVNSPVEFAMLEGLKDGINLLWSLQYEQKMANNIQLIVNYEGRKTGEANTVHVFRMQMRATF